MAEWIDIQSAIEGLMRAFLLDLPTARKTIEEYLVSGRLRARLEEGILSSDREITESDIDLPPGEIPPSAWASVNWDDLFGTISFQFGPDTWMATRIVVEREIALSLITRQVSSAEAHNAGQSAVLEKARTGRPPKYDYVAAAAFLVAYVVERDYPSTKAELVTVVQRWFEEQHRQSPHERELQHFVNVIYSERDRLQRERNQTKR